MSETLSIDYHAWEDHARWWDGEADQAPQRLATDDATLAQARNAFGKIGSSTVGAALAETLQARHEAGQRLGDYAQRVAGHIRRNLGDYRSREQQNVAWLKDTQVVSGGEPGAPAGTGGGPTVVRVRPVSEGPETQGHRPPPGG
jgi:hypothetical protein